ncbi:protein of unknown function [Shewanella benthica]|uniref:Uncharacterized protein n=1 Tax=Shewanella benthica TaxID=43661 RepID=A0A330LV79_9GAMM|nr:protein of unknown function [Shewanella benthica]
MFKYHQEGNLVSGYQISDRGEEHFDNGNSQKYSGRVGRRCSNRIRAVQYRLSAN